jgi:hypothetical protein
MTTQLEQPAAGASVSPCLIVRVVHVQGFASAVASLATSLRTALTSWVHQAAIVACVVGRIPVQQLTTQTGTGEQCFMRGQHHLAAGTVHMRPCRSCTASTAIACLQCDGGVMGTSLSSHGASCCWH